MVYIAVRSGSDARTGGFFEFKAKVVDEPLTVEGDVLGLRNGSACFISHRREYAHLIEDLATTRWAEFIERDYPIRR
jgi:hypothetical protein